MILKNDSMQTIARLLIYIAQADERIEHEEIKYFDDYFRVRTGDETLFTRIIHECKIDIYKKISIEEVVSDLSRNDLLFQVIAILDSFGLALSDTLAKIEEERLVTLCRELKFDARTCSLVESITGVNLQCSKTITDLDIISIGNSIASDDIFITNEDTKSKIFSIDGRLYFFGLNSKGHILLNDSKVLLNGIATEIKEGDYLNLGKFKIYHAELHRRIIRKVNQNRVCFNITFDPSGKRLIVDSVENELVEVDALINVTGNICSLKNLTGDLHFNVDDILLDGDGEINFGLDQRLVVFSGKAGSADGAAGFVLDIAAMLNTVLTREKTTIEGYSKEVKHISNNNNKADIFLESLYTTDEENFIDLFVDIDKTSVLRVENRGYPLLLNGEFLEENCTKLRNGDILKIEREIIFFDFTNGLITNTLSRIDRVDVEHLSYHYGKEGAGLNDISFSSRLGEMTCIMGPSGCGKSTLMKVMLGYQKATSGSVKLNSLDFYKNFNKLKNFVGYVPQDDLLYENLTVFDNLYYSGKLKLPDMPEKQFIDKINELLVLLGLSEKKKEIVGNELKRTLSGGERRRLNIGLELLNDADVIYLDEPTSGLSSYDSKKIIELLSGYAKRGKIIYVVIHQPAPEIFYLFDTLILLDYGGSVAYCGDTKSAVQYFTSKNERIDNPAGNANVSPDVILEILQEVKCDLNGNEIYEINKSGNRVPVRVCTPHEWKSSFENYKNSKSMVNEISPDVNPAASLNDKKETVKERFIRFRSLFVRNFKDRIQDRSSVMMALAAPLILVFVLSFLMRTGSASAFIQLKDYNRIASVIMSHDKKDYYDDRTMALLRSYTFNGGSYNLNGFIPPEDLKVLDSIYSDPEILSVINRGTPQELPLKSPGAELFREILLKTHPFEAELHTFLKYYNSIDMSDLSIKHEASSSDKDKDNNKSDIHKIFRDTGIDKYLFKHNPNFPKFLFLSVIILIFLGLTSSINEIQKDRPKIQREKLLNIRAFDYLMSKTFTTFIFSFIQSAIYVAGAIVIIKIPFAVPELGYYGIPFIVFFFTVSLLLMMASSMLGYFVSSMVRSEKTIFILIPVIMIPQIIFGGLFLSYDDMGGRIFQKDRPVPFYCDLMFSRWGYEGLVSVSSVYNPGDMWNSLVNRYTSDHPDAADGYIEKLEGNYYKSLTLKYNDESHMEMINAKNKWNYLDRQDTVFTGKKSAKENIRIILESHDPYPGVTKKIYNQEFSTVWYNSFILLLFNIFFYFVTLLMIRKVRGV